MQKSSTKQLYNYWNSLRGTRSAPDRKSIDPTRIRDCLAYTFILETDGDESYAFRLAGSHLCSAYCREIKSRAFNDIWHEKDRDAIATLLRAVTDDHAVALTTFSGKTSIGTSAKFEMALMPLLHNGASNVRVLGSMTVIEEPYWLGVQPIVEQRISGLRLIWPDAINETFDVSGESTGVSDLTWREASGGGIATSGLENGARRRYAHLTVIDGGRNS